MSPYDAVVVLGAGIRPDGSIYEEHKVRLDKAGELYFNKETDAIIVCGSHGYKALEKSEVTEAQAYASYLYEKGVPRDKVYLEAESMETLGNLLFAKMHILMKRNWHKLLVIPTVNHSTDRVEYLLKKIFGDDYTWKILRVGENNEQANLEREAKSLMHTRAINDEFVDGDHEAIYEGLKATHPAYGGTKWTIKELREELGR